jgi:hypothetical protein
MKVLLTGCSAPQSSQGLNTRLPTFSGLIRNSLSYSGHEVVWTTPSIDMSEEYLSQFDVVLVGLTPPTSLSSYRLYGALSVINRARKVTNVKYIVDAPEPRKLWAGIRAIANNPEELVKDFYSKRSEYEKAISPANLSRIQEVILDLYENTWEQTLCPSFPWSKKEHVTKHIPNISEDNLDLLCLDSFLLTAVEDSSALYMKSDSDYWSTNQKTVWVKNLEKTLKNKVHPMASNKWSTNTSVLTNINKSIGSLISVYKNDEPWWSVNLSQSLYVNTPVVTDWKQTSYLGNSWSLLAHSLEDMSVGERLSIARKQKDDYIKVLPDFNESVDRVLSSVFDV